jgi:hypothetical protein
MPQDRNAFEFMMSMRGQYIMAQALSVAIETLNGVEPEEMREISNVQDMGFILRNVFPEFSALFTSETVTNSTLDRARVECLKNQQEAAATEVRVPRPPAEGGIV